MAIPDRLDLEKMLLASLQPQNLDNLIIPKSLFEALLKGVSTDALQRVIIADNPVESVNQLEPNNVDLHLSVRRIRKVSGISQAKLAVAAGMEQPDISAFERSGSNGYSRDRKIRIIDALRKIIQGSV